MDSLRIRRKRTDNMKSYAKSEDIDIQIDSIFYVIDGDKSNKNELKYKTFSYKNGKESLLKTKVLTPSDKLMKELALQNNNLNNKNLKQNINREKKHHILKFKKKLFCYIVAKS